MVIVITAGTQFCHLCRRCTRPGCQGAGVGGVLSTLDPPDTVGVTWRGIHLVTAVQGDAVHRLMETLQPQAPVRLPGPVEGGQDIEVINEVFPPIKVSLQKQCSPPELSLTCLLCSRC